MPVADQRLVGNLCAGVENQTEELEPTHSLVFHTYQERAAQAAGVIAGDDEATFNSKIGRWFNANMPRLLCNRQNFTIRNGNILKFAIARQSEPFITDVLGSWNVNLNQIDDTDGRTVLDYIDQRRREAGGNNNLIGIYTRYYDMFRAAGARHAAELRP